MDLDCDNIFMFAVMSSVTRTVDPMKCDRFVEDSDMMMGTKPKISLVTIISQDAAPHKLMLMRTPQEIFNIRIKMR